MYSDYSSCSNFSSGSACHYISSPALRPQSITNYRHLNYNSHCVIVLYRLYDCGVTDEGCAALASALRSNPSHLIQLNLSVNKLGDSGRKLLSDLKKDPHYKLKRLYYCECLFKVFKMTQVQLKTSCVCVQPEFRKCWDVFFLQNS